MRAAEELVLAQPVHVDAVDQHVVVQREPELVLAGAGVPEAADEARPDERLGREPPEDAQ